MNQNPSESFLQNLSGPCKAGIVVTNVGLFFGFVAGVMVLSDAELNRWFPTSIGFVATVSLAIGLGLVSVPPEGNCCVLPSQATGGRKFCFGAGWFLYVIEMINASGLVIMGVADAYVDSLWIFLCLFCSSISLCLFLYSHNMSRQVAPQMKIHGNFMSNDQQKPVLVQTQISVQVPVGYVAGQTFPVTYGGRQYLAQVPVGYVAGQVFTIAVPVPAVAVPVASPIASEGYPLHDVTVTAPVA